MTNILIDTPLSVSSEPGIDYYVDLNKDAHKGIFNGTMYCPCTNTVFLRPRQFEPGFTPTSTSVQALTFPDTDNWENVAIGSNANNKFAISKNASTAEPYTGSIAANTPIVVTFFCYGQTGVVGTYQVATFKFGAYVLNINSDGYCAIGNQSGYITGGYNSQTNRQSLTNRWVRLLIMPLNRTDVLLLSDAGGAWLYKTALEPDDPDNVIISAAAFKFSFPHSKAIIQVQTAVFPSSGTYDSELHNLAYAPQTGRTVTLLGYYDAPTGAGINALAYNDSDTAFVPDGMSNKIKMHFELTSTGSASPQLYGCNINITGLQVARNSSSQQVSADTMVNSGDNDSAKWSWPSTVPQGTSISVLNGSNAEIFAGIASNSDVIGSQAPSAESIAQGMMSMLSHAVFYEDWRIDGLLDGDVIKMCLSQAGVPTSKYVVNDGGTIPGDPRGKVTMFPIKAGTTAEAVVNLVSELLSNEKLTVRKVGSVMKFTYGVTPTGTSAKTYYKSHLAAGWNNAAWSNVKTWYGPRVKESKPWNGVIVRGKSVTGNYIYATYNDTTAQDPDLTLSERGANWFGAPVIKYINDDRLCTQDAVDYVRDIMKDRFVTTYMYAKWIAEDDDLVSKDSIVTLEHYGSFRVIEKIESSYQKETDSMFKVVEITGVQEI